jgi:hypothetical protein
MVPNQAKPDKYTRDFTLAGSSRDLSEVYPLVSPTVVVNSNETVGVYWMSCGLSTGWLIQATSGQFRCPRATSEPLRVGGVSTVQGGLPLGLDLLGGAEVHRRRGVHCASE